MKREGNGRKREGYGLNEGVGFLNVKKLKNKSGLVGYASLMT